MHGAFHQPDLDFAVRHGLGHFGGVADQGFDRNVRMFGAERHQPLRQPIAGDGLAGHHREHAALQACQIRQRPLGGIRLGQHRASLGQEDAAFLGQLDAPPYAMEQGDTGAALQAGDGRRHRRLGAMKDFCGARDMLAFRHRHEQAQLLQRHK